MVKSRKKRNPASSDWPETRGAIERFCGESKIPETDFRPLGPGEWEEVRRKVVDRFFIKRKSQNPIELKNIDASVSLDYRVLFDSLKLALPVNEQIWIMVDEWDIHSTIKYWIYEGKTSTALDVLGETIFHTAYFVSKKMDWIAEIEEHDVLSVTGKNLAAYIESIRKSIQR